MSRPRDTQRAKLYRAERSAFKDPQWNALMDLGTCTIYIERVLHSAFWKEHVKHTYPLNIRDGRGCRKASAGADRITLPCWARKHWVILHELSHTGIGRTLRRSEVAAHGREFAAFYLRLVRHFLGVAAHDALRDAFRANGVRYKPKKKLTPEALAVLRERGMALAAKRRENSC